MFLVSALVSRLVLVYVFVSVSAVCECACGGMCLYYYYFIIFIIIIIILKEFTLDGIISNKSLQPAHSLLTTFRPNCLELLQVRE